MKVFSPFLNGTTTTSGSFNVPNHPSTGSIPNPLTGSLFHDDTDGILKIYTGTQWQVVGEQTGPGPASANIEYLLVAGGGGAGGYDGSAYQVGDAGTDSSIAGAAISTVTATGGGRGAVWNNDGSQDGGSGGGASGNRSAGSGTNGQGNDGGTAPSGLQGGSGGGGGAGQAGSNGTTTKYGDGGDGLASSITGVSTYYAGGGGAGGWNYPNTMTRGDGGLGGGGNGTVEVSDGNAANVGNPGTANTGGGAGAGDYGVGANHGGGGAGGLLSSSFASVTSGSSFTVTVGGGGAAGGSYGAAGGSGVAIFAYDSGSINGAGGIVGDAGNGRKYNQFNESDTFKVGSTSDFQIVTSNLLLNFDAGDFSSRGTSTVTDLSGNGNNGTVGNATLNNYHYSFNGSNSYITAPPTSFVSSAYSIETWLYKSSLDSSYDCIYAAGPELQTYFRSNFIEFYIDVGDSGGYEVNGLQLTGLSAATWYHYTVTDNGSGSVKMYLNGGTQTNTTTYTGNPGVHSGTPRIGDYAPSAGSYPFNGNIAQFRIYTKALTDAEVLQNYNATKTNFV